MIRLFHLVIIACWFQISHQCPFLRDGNNIESIFDFKDDHVHIQAAPPPPPPKTAPGPPPPPPKPPITNGPTRALTSPPTLTPTFAVTPATNAPVPPVSSPSNFCLKTNGAPLVASAANTCIAYKAIKTAFLNAVPNDAFGQANLYGQAIRIAFHDAGEADITSADLSRSDGCLSTDSANAGLVESTSLINTVLEPIWQQNCDLISRADFWVLVAQLAIQNADPTKTIAFNYQYGRTDALTCSAGTGRLPNAVIIYPICTVSFH